VRCLVCGVGSSAHAAPRLHARSCTLFFGCPTFGLSSRLLDGSDSKWGPRPSTPPLSGAEPDMTSPIGNARNFTAA
jgi:hypothetical protein